MKQSYYISLGFLILAQTLVGINIVSSKYLLSSIPTLWLLVVRFSLASIILLPLHWLTIDNKIPLKQHLLQMQNKDWIFLISQALCAGAIFNCFMLLGLHYTDAHIAGIITSALPALIAILSIVILKEKLSSKKIIAVLFATIGLVVIALGKIQGTQSNFSLLGDICILLSLIPEALYYILCKLHPNRLPIFLSSAIINSINALAILPFLIIFHLPLAHIPFHMLVILIILSLSSSLFFIFWLFGSKQVDSIMGSLSTAVMPIATTFFAYIFLGEQLSFQEGIGMILVLLSILAYTIY